MALRSDANGFLVGETIQDLKRVGKGLSAIQKDVREIKRLLGINHNEAPKPVILTEQSSGQGSSNNEQGGQDASQLLPTVDTGTDNSITPTETEQADTVQPTVDAGISPQPTNDETNSQTHNPRPRDALGRFISENTDNENNGDSAAVDTSESKNTIEFKPHVGKVNGSGTETSDSITRAVPKHSYVLKASSAKKIGTSKLVRLSRNEFVVPPKTVDKYGKSFFESANKNGSLPAFSGGGSVDGDNKNTGISIIGNVFGNAIDALGDRITTALNTDGLEEVDPTVKAFQETVEPLKRGYQFVFGSGDRKDKPYFAWFNKIWKTLKKTEQNTAENGDSSDLGIIGLITTFITAGVLAWGLFSKDGKEFWSSLKQKFIDPVVSSISNWLKESSGYNKVVDFVTPIVDFVSPVIESLIQSWSVIFTNMGTAWDLAVASFSAAWDIATTAIPEIFKVAALAFSAIWTPIADFFTTNILPAIIAGWDKVTSIGAAAFDYISKAFDAVLDVIKSIFTGIAENWNKIAGFVGDVFTSFSNFMKDKFGIDIPAAVSIVTETVSDAGKSVADQASAAKQALTDKISSMAQPVLDQAALAKQNITDVVDKESKSVVDAADKNSKATEKTATAMEDYLKKLADLGAKIGGALISPASANEKPYGVDNPSKESNVDLEAKLHEAGKRYGFDSNAVLKNYENSGVDKNILLAQAYKESRFNPNAGSEKGARGFSQMIPSTAAHYGLKDTSDAVASSKAQSIMMKEKLDKYGDIQLALAAYNGGDGAADWFKDAKNKHWMDKPDSRIKGDAKHNSLWRVETADYAKTIPEIAYGEKSHNTKQVDTITTDAITAAMPQSQATAPLTQLVSQPSPVMPVMPKMPKMADSPPIVTPLANDSITMPQPTVVSDIGQNLPDNRLAHIASPYGGFRGG